MNKITEKQPELRFWIRLPTKHKAVQKMKEDMEWWHNQTAFFLHLLANYYLTKNKNGKK